jgi:hypothetical protein
VAAVYYLMTLHKQVPAERTRLLEVSEPVVSRDVRLQVYFVRLNPVQSFRFSTSSSPLSLSTVRPSLSETPPPHAPFLTDTRT